MKINLPNRLTLLRIAMIPVYVVLVSFAGLGWQIAAVAVFLAACITDLLDGKIARARNLVTDFGKFADPIADKLLVMSCFVMLVYQERMPGWVCIIFLAREFIISGFRLIAAGSGKVISAGMLGKIKTNTQMAAAVALMLLKPFGGMEPLLGNAGAIIADILMYIACFMTVWSGTDYIWKNRSFISDM